MITDEGVARLRQRIGVARPHSAPPRYLSPNEDAFRHVALAYGDDNPLWCDPSYGPTTRWGSAIASPHLVGGDTLIGEDEVTRLEGAERELMKGDPLGGVHAFYSGSYREWWNPLLPNTRVSRRNALVGVIEKEGQFAGAAVHEWFGEVFGAIGGPMLSGQYRLMIRTEREKARGAQEQRRHRDRAVHRRADRGHRGGRRRRARPPSRRRAPLVGGRRGGRRAAPAREGPAARHRHDRAGTPASGMGLYGVSALRQNVDHHRRMPKFFKRDKLNIPDVQQRLHWDDDWAKRAGNPTSLRLRPHARGLARPPLHRLDG